MTEDKQYKIAFFGVKSWEKEVIEKQIIKLDTFGVGIFRGEVQDNIDLAAKYDILSLSVNSKLTGEVLAKLPKLKLVTTRSTGKDHIDGRECLERKIAVVNVPTYGSGTVAEYAMGLLLAVTKRIVVAHQSVEEGTFNTEGLTGVDLTGKTIGVIGVGSIGQNVIHIARGFRMKVLGVDRKRDPKLAKRMGFRYVDLESCLKQADFVTIHVPFVPETFHMINKKNIKLLKTGSFLINVSRGPVVEIESLVWALNNKILAGVGLDVTEEERLVDKVSTVMGDKISKDDLKEIVSFHLLRDRDDVVFTPHNAFNTKEAIERIVTATVESIGNYIKSESRKS
ncbi:MAG: NAD(P)-dependent oxidoreductase [Candidatus Shapirobacteria bacterium]|jgi:D-lactate dehydrogenase